MANYVPNNRIPLINICQEIQNVRANNVNEEVDIQIPPYLIDRRILKAVEYRNFNYLTNFVKKCPRNVERYFYLESVTSTNPVIRSIVISNLLGFALLYRATNCLHYLLSKGSDPFQATYFIESVSQFDRQNKIVLYEAPTFILLAGSLQEKYKTDCVDMLKELRQSETELHVPVAIRKQQIEVPNEPVSITIRFADAWECLEKELDKKGGTDCAQNKGILHELKAVYRANKFERLNEPKTK
ncbi:hypothetical protein EG68_05304 [Paragonimus skrjabini miyazakii]|uniref:Uncharacterized protein n=1 Tax=Paragonimus skrjabini miyazakii TaxID=59628 RepID=A0A8S9YUF9_9TREM|nr:hypothetical protein EG68_05304 [Paragonimus skrjabini miyazakii]